MSTDAQLTDFIDPNDPLNITLRFDGGDTVVVETHVKFVMKTSVVIHIPYEDLEFMRPHLKEGKTLEVEFRKRANDRAVRMHTTISAFKQEHGKEGGTCLVEVAEGFQRNFILNRAHVRVPIKLDVMIIPHPKSEGPRREPFQTLAVNLSGGGMRLIIEEKNSLTVGDYLTIRFTPPDETEPIRLPAEVVLSRPTGGRPPKYITAVKFQNLHRALEDQLVGICFKFQLAQHHLKT